MNEFEFKVLINERECNGVMSVEAENTDEAYEKAVELVGSRLFAVLPELDIEYEIRMIEE